MKREMKADCSMPLRVEQQHVVYLRKQVCAREKQGDGSNLPTHDACDFSQLWAEKAAKVPIRIKKQI
jgi:hypothetical protein